MLSDISTDPYLPGSNKYTKALIYLCLTNTANTLGCQFACAYQIPRLDFRRLPGPVLILPEDGEECGLIFPNSGW